MSNNRRLNLGSTNNYLDGYFNRPSSGYMRESSQKFEQPKTKLGAYNHIYNESDKYNFAEKQKKLEQNYKSKEGNFEWLTHFYSEHFLVVKSAARVADIVQKYMKEVKKIVIYTSEANYGNITSELQYKISKFKASVIYINASHKQEKLILKQGQFMTDEYKILVTTKGSIGSFMGGVIDVEDVDLIICDDLPDYKEYKQRLLRSKDLSKDKRGVVITVCDSKKVGTLIGYQSLLGIRLKKMQVGQSLIPYLKPVPKKKAFQQSQLSTEHKAAIIKQPATKQLHQIISNSSKTDLNPAQQGNFNWLVHCQTSKQFYPWVKIVKILNNNASLYKKVLVYTQERAQKLKRLKDVIKTQLKNKSEVIVISDEDDKKSIKYTMDQLSKSYSSYKILITTRSPEAMFQAGLIDIAEVNLIVFDGVMQPQEYKRRLQRSKKIKQVKGIAVTVIDYQDTNNVHNIEKSLKIKIHNLQNNVDLSEYYDYQIHKIQDKREIGEKSIQDLSSLQKSTASRYSVQTNEYKNKEPLKIQQKRSDYQHYENQSMIKKKPIKEKQEFIEQKTQPKLSYENTTFTRNITVNKPLNQVKSPGADRAVTLKKDHKTNQQSALNRPVSGSAYINEELLHSQKYEVNGQNYSRSNNVVTADNGKNNITNDAVMKKLQKIQTTAKETSEKQSLVLQNQIDFQKKHQNTELQLAQIKEQQRRTGSKKNQDNQIGQKILKQGQKILEAVNKKPLSTDQNNVNQVTEGKQLFKQLRQIKLQTKESNRKLDNVVLSSQNINKGQNELKAGVQRNFKEINQNTKLLQQLVEDSRANRKRLTTDDLAKKMDQLNRSQMRKFQQALQRIISIEEKVGQSQSPIKKEPSSIDRLALQTKQKTIKAQAQEIAKYRAQLQEKGRQYQKVYRKLAQLETQKKQMPKPNLQIRMPKSQAANLDTENDKFLTESQIYDKLNQEDKNFLYNTIKKTMTSVTMQDFKLKSKTIFQSSQSEHDYWHGWIQMCCDKQNFLCLIQLDNNHVIFGFSQAQIYDPERKNLKQKNACLASVTNKNVYMIKKNRIKKALYLSSYSIEFGNSQLVILGQLRLMSLVGKMNMSYFPVREPTQNFLGQQVSTDFDKYYANRMEFHQIFPVQKQ